MLTFLAFGPADDSPWTMMLVALSFVVLVKGWPSKRWLYATVVALSFALYWGYLIHWPPDRQPHRTRFRSLRERGSAPARTAFSVERESPLERMRARRRYPMPAPPRHADVVCSRSQRHGRWR